MHIIQRLGMGLFLLVTVLFIATLFMGRYQLTPRMVEEVITEMGQLDYIKSEVQELYQKTYTSKFAFISDLDDAFSSSASKIQDYNQIDNREVEINNLDDHTAGQYKFYLTRKATSGPDKRTCRSLVAPDPLPVYTGCFFIHTSQTQSSARYQKRPHLP